VVDSKRPEKQISMVLKNERKLQSGDPTEYLENRNIIPNIACNILSFIRRVNRSGPSLEKILASLEQKSGEKISTVKKFYAYQHFLKETYSDFKGKDAI
jgi:hypothetical protein